MVATRKSIPRGSNASDDLANSQDPKAQAVLKALQINAGEALCGAQVLGKRNSDVVRETYTYNGATYEVDQNTMVEWVEKSRKKRKLEKDGTSMSPAPQVEKEKARERPEKNNKRMRREDEEADQHVEDMERPAKKHKKSTRDLSDGAIEAVEAVEDVERPAKQNRKRTRDLSDDAIEAVEDMEQPAKKNRKTTRDLSDSAVEAVEDVERPAKIRRMRDTPCMDDEASPAATYQEPDHQTPTRRYRRPVVADEEDMEDAQVAQDAAVDEIHYAAADSASPRQSAMDDEIHYRPASNKPRRQEKDPAKNADKSKHSKEQARTKKIPDNAADDIRNARRTTKRLVRGTRPADKSTITAPVTTKSAAIHASSAEITTEVQHKSAMECFRNLQRMSKANSRVHAILAKARALKAKVQPPITKNRKTAGQAVLSPPTSREPSSIDAQQTSPEIPDSDPAGPDRSSTTLPMSPITAPSLTSSTPPTMVSALPSNKKDGGPLRWRLDATKLNDSDNAASEIYRHKRQGESPRERRRRRRHEEAVVMSWKLLEDDAA